LIVEKLREGCVEEPAPKTGMCSGPDEGLKEGKRVGRLYRRKKKERGGWRGEKTLPLEKSRQFQRVTGKGKNRGKLEKSRWPEARVVEAETIF